MLITIKLPDRSVAIRLAQTLLELNQDPARLRKLLPKLVPLPNPIPIQVVARSLQVNAPRYLELDSSRPFWLNHYLVLEAAAGLSPEQVVSLRLALGLVNVGTEPRPPFLRYSVSKAVGLAPESFVMELPFRLEAARPAFRRRLADFLSSELEEQGVTVRFDDELPSLEDSGG